MAASFAGLLIASPAVLSGDQSRIAPTIEGSFDIELSTANTWLGDWTSIAVIRGSDGIAQTHVSNLLSLHGIGVTIMGSLSYAVFVENSDAERAKRILIDDATKNPYWLRVGESGFERTAKTITMPINLKTDEYGMVKTDPRNPYVERAIREAYRSLNPKGFGVLHGGPTWNFVQNIELVQRRYLDKMAQWNVGYDFKVQFVSTESKGAFFDYRGCVWDEGKQCQVSGGSGSYH